MTETQMFDYIYNNYTKHDKKLPSSSIIGVKGEHTEKVKVTRFLDNMRKKLLSKTATPEQELGCEKIKLYASRSAAAAVRATERSDEWTEEKLNEILVTLTGFQEKLGDAGVGKRPGLQHNVKSSPFTKIEQKLSRRVELDIAVLKRFRRQQQPATNEGFLARKTIYADRGLVEFMPDWDGTSSSSFTTTEMRTWNAVRRIVVNEPLYKPPKTRKALAKRKTPSNAGLLANSDRPPRSTRAPRPNPAPSRTRRKRKASTLEEQQQTEDEIVEERIVPGIINAGNTCYAASSLQLLFSSSELIAALHAVYTSQSSLGKELPLTEAVLNVAKDIGLINEEGVVQSAVFTTVAVPSSVASNPNSLKVFLNDSMNDAASLLKLKTIVDGIVGNFHDVSADSDDDEPEEKDTHV